jgi:hypothetical protein
MARLYPGGHSHPYNTAGKEAPFVGAPTYFLCCSAQNPTSDEQQENSGNSQRSDAHGSDMQYVQDSFDAGSLVAAWLAPHTLGQLEPILRRLLAGQQLFVKQADGSYRPKGFQLGLPRSFEFTDLQGPALRNAG